MKITYEFDKDEDRHNIRLYERAEDMYSALFNIAEILRKYRKRNINIKEEELLDRLIEEVQEELIASNYCEIE